MRSILLDEGSWHVCPDHYDEALCEALHIARDQGLRRPITIQAPEGASCGGCATVTTIEDIEPLTLLIMLRALLAMRDFEVPDLRAMSLRQAIIAIGHIVHNAGPTLLVTDLLAISDLEVWEAEQLLDSCLDIALADVQLSLVVEPNRRVIRAH